MKYHDHKVQQSNRGIDIRNMTPIWDPPGGHEYTPVLGRERGNTWARNNNGKLRLYNT